jgi:hypothetical protein
MEPLKLKEREIPLGEIEPVDAAALLDLYLKYTGKPAALRRLKLAAIGLAWWAGPTKPPFDSLEAVDFDLLKFGEGVGKALRGENQRDLQGRGDAIVADAFELLVPTPATMARAEGFSEEESEKGSDDSSGSEPKPTATPSPSSAASV